MAQSTNGSHYKVKIEGLDILFPYQPYDIQKNYMKTVIKAIESKTNALIESPTGTGKTLSLLCSIIAWMESRSWKDEDLDLRIIYASRTHQQLKQAAGELKKSAYGNIPTVVLGSKDQLCINPMVSAKSSLAEKNGFCKSLSYAVKPQNMCQYLRLSYDDAAEIMNAAPKDRPKVRQSKLSRLKQAGALRVLDAAPRVMDMEDLYKAGKKVQFCPYFASTEIARSNVRVIFCPYNYILENYFELPVENSVIVFDEGHNIEAFCEESASSSINIEQIETIDNGLSAILEFSNKIKDIISHEDIDRMRKFVGAKGGLKEAIENETAKNSGNQSFCLPGIWIQDFLREQHVSVTENSDTQLNSIRKLYKVIESIHTHHLKVPDNFISSCEALLDLVKKSLPTDNKDGNQLTTTQKFSEKFASIYGIAVIREGPKRLWTLKLYCCTPSVTMKKLVDKKVRSILITSGTLAPMDSYSVDMGIKFPHVLHNPHVIQRDQLHVIPVPCHIKPSLTKSREEKVNIIKLDSSFNGRNLNGYYEAIGELIKTYTSFIPGGILLFFPSYAFKMSCIKKWEELHIMINSHKKLFDEPSNRNSFPQILQQFKEEVDREGSPGAILTGVYRGKLSEGIDLKDNYCRTTIVIGLPYPSMIDPKIMLKKGYLESMEYSSGFWYNLQMMRAVNQAIGRIIRHKDDYGLILLLDYRYSSIRLPGEDGCHENVIMNLSKWLHKFVLEFENFEPLNKKFFDNFFEKNISRLRELESNKKMDSCVATTSASADMAALFDEFDDEEDELACQTAANGVSSSKKPKLESDHDVIKEVCENLLSEAEFDLIRRENEGENILYPVL